MGQMIDEVYEGKYHDYDVNFKGILLNSSLVASFSIFETVFKNVIHHANYIFNKKISTETDVPPKNWILQK